MFGEVDTSNLKSFAYVRNIRRYRVHCLHESGIAGYIRLRLTEVVEPNGDRRLQEIIGISENTRARRKLPPVSGIRKLMEVLETNEAPRWYVVDPVSY